MLRSLIFVLFLFVGSARAADHPLIELRDEIVGSSMRVHTMRVSAVGVVTEEHYDITADSKPKWPSNGTRRVAKLSASQLQEIKRYIHSVLSSLPKRIERPGPIALDSSNRSICNTSSTGYFCSNMDSYEDPDSPDSIRFRQSWDYLMRALRPGQRPN